MNPADQQDRDVSYQMKRHSIHLFHRFEVLLMIESDLFHFHCQSVVVVGRQLVEKNIGKWVKLEKTSEWVRSSMTEECLSDDCQEKEK